MSARAKNQETQTMLDMPLAEPPGAQDASQVLALPQEPGRVVASQQAAQDGVAGSLLNFVAEALTNPNIDVSKLEALLRMQREIVADDARGQFNRALHEAQAEMPRVKKNGTITMKRKDGSDGGSIPFARWEDVDSVVRPIALRHGFSTTFSNEDRGQFGIKWTATHRHIAGHQEQNSITLPQDDGPGRNSNQASGSTQGYAKRYLVEGFYNIVREGIDDDGKSSGKVITEEQLTALQGLIKDNAFDDQQVEAFVDWLGVKTLPDLPAALFDKAKNSLLARKAKKAAGAPT